MGQRFRRGFTAAEKAEFVGSLAAGEKRLGERLASRHRPFIGKWHRTVGFVLRHGVARDWHWRSRNARRYPGGLRRCRVVGK